jgi:hypothetical protein
VSVYDVLVRWLTTNDCYNNPDSANFTHWKDIRVHYPWLAVVLYQYSSKTNAIDIIEAYDVLSAKKRVMRVLLHKALDGNVYWLLNENSRKLSFKLISV